MKGEWLGDGCLLKRKRDTYFNITTVSRELAFQLQAIYARLGITATINSFKSKNKLRTYYVNVFGRHAVKLARMWHIKLNRYPKNSVDKFHINKNFIFMPIKKIETKMVKNFRVMDITVEHDHTFAPIGLATSNCVDACPIVNTNPEFIGPQALSQAYRYYADSRDEAGKARLGKVDLLKGVWDCEFAGSCSDVCPKGVDPAFAIQLLKTEIIKNDLLNIEGTKN
jgi:hypothetical protein